MSRAIGKPARYVSEAAVGKHRKLVDWALTGLTLCSFLTGLVIGANFLTLKSMGWSSLALVLVLLVVAYGLNRWLFPALTRPERERNQFRRGAEGEELVARELAQLPDSFRVIHDLSLSGGNLDHIVIGPTGLFVLDAKNWRGEVKPDGAGDLLLNDRPLDKACVRPFLKRILDLKERIKTRIPEMDPYYQAVMVFTAARVGAPWGSTRSVRCLSQDQLRNYLLDGKHAKPLSAAQVEKLAAALEQLARREADFVRHDSDSDRPGRSANRPASGRSCPLPGYRSAPAAH